DSDISIIPICGYEIDDNNYLIGTSSIKSFTPNIRNGLLINIDSTGNIIRYKKYNTDSFFDIYDFINGELIFTDYSSLIRMDTAGQIRWKIDFPDNFGNVRKRIIKNHRGNYCYLYKGAEGTYYREITSSGQIIKDQQFGIGSNVNPGIWIQDAQYNFVV